METQMIDGIRWLGRKHRWGLELGLWAVGIGLVSSLPYVVGYLAIGPERRFMGFAFNVSDHVQYFAWWRAFQQGFLAPNLLTPEPTPATYFNLLWWLLAQVSRIAGLGYEATYQVLRVLSILITVAVLGLLYRRVAPSVSQARAMLAMALLGSGFAWLHPVVKRLQGWLPFPSLMAPYVPSIAEPNTFFSAIAYPHFLIALASITAILWLAYEGIECGRWRASLGAGLLALSLSLHHTYDLLTIGAVLGGMDPVADDDAPLRPMGGGRSRGAGAGDGGSGGALHGLANPPGSHVAGGAGPIRQRRGVHAAPAAAPPAPGPSLPSGPRRPGGSPALAGLDACGGVDGGVVPGPSPLGVSAPELSDPSAERLAGSHRLLGRARRGAHRPAAARTDFLPGDAMGVDPLSSGEPLSAGMAHPGLEPGAASLQPASG
jgi:hypothetical protein